MNRSVALERDLDLRGWNWSEVSAFLYGGETRFARGIRKRNAAGKSAIVTQTRIRYARPEVRVRPGDNLTKIGRKWVGRSGQSYRILLELNPGLANPDALVPGTWLVVPRIPNPKEREFLVRGKQTDFKSGPVSLAAPGSQDVGLDGALLPNGAEERLELVKWYLARLNPEKQVGDRKRTDTMVEQLIQKLPESELNWEPAYIAAQYYVRTGRPEKASVLLSQALKDPKAPIQVAILYWKNRKNTDSTPEERNRLFGRFPAMKALSEDEDSSVP